MPKLYQAVAVRTGEEKKLPEKLKRVLTPIKMESAQRGFVRVFSPLIFDDGGRSKYSKPSEGQDVRVNVETELPKLWDLFAQSINNNMTVELANPTARADVFLKGQVEPIFKDVPVTALLALEKDLDKILSQINALPVNPVDTQWSWDPNRKAWTSPTVTTNTSVREREFVVVVPSTEYHPAQIKELEKEIIVGTWSKIDLSGSLTQGRVDLLRSRCEELIAAVSDAKQRANAVDVVKSDFGTRALEYIYSP